MLDQFLQILVCQKSATRQWTKDHVERLSAESTTIQTAIPVSLLYTEAVKGTRTTFSRLKIVKHFVFLEVGD